MSAPAPGKGIAKLAAISLGAFVFTFSLVPLYRIACEKVFGIKLEQGPAGEARVAGLQVDESRTVVVEFDGTVNSKLPWEFKPSQLRMEVVPGKPYEATYVARNTSDHAIVGNAAPSVAPSTASTRCIEPVTSPAAPWKCTCMGTSLPGRPVWPLAPPQA